MYSYFNGIETITVPKCVLNQRFDRAWEDTNGFSISEYSELIELLRYVFALPKFSQGGLSAMEVCDLYRHYQDNVRDLISNDTQ